MRFALLRVITLLSLSALPLPSFASLQCEVSVARNLAGEVAHPPCRAGVTPLSADPHTHKVRFELHGSALIRCGVGFHGMIFLEPSEVTVAVTNTVGEIVSLKSSKLDRLPPLGSEALVAFSADMQGNRYEWMTVECGNSESPAEQALPELVVQPPPAEEKPESAATAAAAPAVAAAHGARHRRRGSVKRHAPAKHKAKAKSAAPKRRRR